MDIAELKSFSRTLSGKRADALRQSAFEQGRAQGIFDTMWDLDYLISQEEIPVPQQEAPL